MSPRRWFIGAALKRLREFAGIQGGFGRAFTRPAPNGVSRYVPHQGAREMLRRRLGGFARVPKGDQGARAAA